MVTETKRRTLSADAFKARLNRYDQRWAAAIHRARRAEAMGQVARYRHDCREWVMHLRNLDDIYHGRQPARQRAERERSLKGLRESWEAMRAAWRRHRYPLLGMG